MNLRKIIRQILEENFGDNYDFSKHSFTTGDCDIYAVSLHRLHGYPLYVVRGWIKSDSEEDDEINYEDCHIVVKLPSGMFLDSRGEQSEMDLIQDARFMNDVYKVTVEPISEEIALSTFSCQDQESEIRQVMDYISEENSRRYKLLGYSDDYNEGLEEYGIDEYEAYERAHEIAKNGGVNILRDKHLIIIMVDLKEEKVIGGLWVSQDRNKFSFDIALDSNYQNMGLSSELIKAAISEYEMQKEMYGDDLKMEVDVINPKLAQILKNKYGFYEVGTLAPDRVLMSLSEGSIDDFKYDVVKKAIQGAVNNGSINPEDIISDKYFIVCFGIFGNHISTVSTFDKDEAKKLVKNYKNQDDVWKIYVEKPTINSMVLLRREDKWIVKK